MKDKDNKFEVPKEKLRFIYNDIIFGYSLFDYFKGQDCYIKHFTSMDSARVDEVNSEATQKAEKMGLVKEKDQLKFLEKEDLWTSKEEEDLKELEGFIKSLEISKKKLFIKEQIEEIDAQIDTNSKVLLEKSASRSELVGFTSERYAHKKTNEYYVFSSLYKDRELKQSFYDEESFDYLSSKELENLVIEYNLVNKKFSSETLKRISLSGFFLNFFYVSEDNPYYFFGKPIVDLTFYQVQLYSFGRNYKNMLQNAKNKPPEEMFDDPDKLTEFFEQGEEAMKVIERLDAKGKDPVGGKEKAGGATSLVGATKQDLERLGLGEDQGEYISLSKEAAKKGGKLDIYELMKIHNVK